MAFRFLKLPRVSLAGRLLVGTTLAVLAVAVSTLFLLSLFAERRLGFEEKWLVFLFSLLLGFGVAVGLALVLTRKLRCGLSAINQGLLNLMDNDFSVTLGLSNLDELDSIIHHYNHLVNSLRQERQNIYQRELLLDTIIENSSMSVVITDQNQRVIYANREAENLLHNGKSINSLTLPALLSWTPTLRNAIEREQSGIFRLDEQAGGLHHLSCGRFMLNTQHHTLILIKEMTREMNRQEAATWKKVIRVISHELNNSLAPISSLAHSGQLMLNKGQHRDLPEVFATLAERAEHLKNFVGRYAEIAKLPSPHKTTVDWSKFYQSLTQSYPFRLEGTLPVADGHFDAGQLHQVMLNLLKNAAESGSLAEDVSLCLRQNDQASIISVADRGTGMTSDVMHNALLPFYSTKPTGSGVGLPLCREIVEAHEGQLSLSNRRRGGLRVTIILPLPQATN